MSAPDLRETWPALLAALRDGDDAAIEAAFEDQQRAFAAAVLALDAEALTSNLDPAYELHNHGELFFDWRDVYRGRDGVMEWARQIADTAGEFTFSLERIERSGERFATLGQMHASGRTSAIETTFPWAQIWTLRGDRILRIDVYTDHGRALEALQAPAA
jgi:ketosteroid isomerase-like protein